MGGILYIMGVYYIHTYLTIYIYIYFNYTTKRYEMMLMAYQYEMKYPGVDLSEFYSQAHVIQTEPIRELLKCLMDERAQYLCVMN
jgi:hypothetical protein